MTEFTPGNYSHLGIRGSANQQIPRQELDRREVEVEQVMSLLEQNPAVILTSESSGSGKTTFAGILRHYILQERKGETPFKDCVFIHANQVESAKTRAERQDTLSTYDLYSFPNLIRFDGLVIVDDVFPDQFPMFAAIKNARVVCVIEPKFLDGPPFEDNVHKDFLDTIREKDMPIYELPPYQHLEQG